MKTKLNLKELRLSSIVLILVMIFTAYSCSEEGAVTNESDSQKSGLVKDLAYFTKIDHESQRIAFLDLSV